MMKKFFLLCGLTLLSWLGVIGVSFAQNSLGNQENSFYYEGGSIGKTTDTDYGKLIKDDAVTPDESLLNRLMSVFNLDQPDYHGPQKAFYYIKKILNHALSFVSLIALCLLIYSFYGMLTWDGDKQYTKVKEILKGIAIAIIVMGLARLIVSLLFWLYQNPIQWSLSSS